MAVGGAGHDVEAPELPLGERPFGDDELQVESFGVAVLGALQEAIVTGTTGAQVDFHHGDGAVRNELERTLLRRLAVVICSSHSVVPLSSGLSSVDGGDRRRSRRRLRELADELAEIRRLELIEAAAAILGRIAPRVGRGADEAACESAVAEVDPLIGDDLIDDTWELAAGTGAFKLQPVFGPVEFVRDGLKNSDERSRWRHAPAVGA